MKHLTVLLFLIFKKIYSVDAYVKYNSNKRHRNDTTEAESFTV